MPAVSRLGLYGGPQGILGIVAVASASVTGSFTEAQIVAGGEQIVITLTNDAWVAAGAAFNAQRQAIIDGLDSAQSELTGWNNEVRDSELVTAVARTSNTVVTITLTAAPAYNITANETITVTIPAAALAGAVELIATPTLTVTADLAAVVLRGGDSSKKALRMLMPDERLHRQIQREDDEVLALVIAFTESRNE